jgi:hypothetical protein
MSIPASLAILSSLGLNLVGWTPTSAEVVQADFETYYLSMPEFQAEAASLPPEMRDTDGPCAPGAPVRRFACGGAEAPSIVQPSGFSAWRPGAASTR